MSVNVVNPTTGGLTKIAGGSTTLYADAPVGAIMPYGGTTAPDGFLLCQGQAVSRTTYAELFAVIGTSFGAGDGSTTFNVPDLREATTKGVGLSGKSNNHYDVDGIALGEFVEDRIQNITGSTGIHGSGGAPTGAFYIGSNANGTAVAPSTGAYNKIEIDASRVARTGDTTEVKAVGVNYIIKATIIALPSDFEVAVDAKLNNYVKTSVLTSWTDVTSEAASFTGSIRTNTIQIFSNGYECKIIGELLLDVAQPINQGWIESLVNISINNGYRPKTTTSLSGFFAANYHSPIIWQVAPSGRISGFTGSNLTEISRIPINGTWSLYN